MTRLSLVAVGSLKAEGSNVTRRGVDGENVTGVPLRKAMIAVLIPLAVAATSPTVMLSGENCRLARSAQSCEIAMLLFVKGGEMFSSSNIGERTEIVFKDVALSMRVLNGRPVFRCEDLRRLLNIQRATRIATSAVFDDGPYANDHVATTLVSKRGDESLRDWFVGVALNGGLRRRTYNSQLQVLTETDLHEKVVHFVRTYFKDTLLVAGLGELQDTDEKRICAKRKGYTKGQVDLMIMAKSTKYSGMALEFKTPTGYGVTPPEQEHFHEELRLAGFKVIVSNCYDEILLAITSYMEHRRFTCTTDGSVHRSREKVRAHEADANMDASGES